MKIHEITALGGFSHPNAINRLRERGQLPVDDDDNIAAPRTAFRLLLQSEVSRFCGMDQAADVVRSVDDKGFRQHWPQICAGHYWLIVTYDSVNLAPTDEAIELIGAALRNGSAQKGWPVNLHEVLQVLLDRAYELRIVLPPVDDVAGWWTTGEDNAS